MSVKCDFMATEIMHVENTVIAKGMIADIDAANKLKQCEVLQKKTIPPVSSGVPVYKNKLHDDSAAENFLKFSGSLILSVSLGKSSKTCAIL